MNDIESVLPADETKHPSPRRTPVLHFWRCFWLMFLVASLGYAWYCFYVPANDITWADDYASAQRKAAISDKPMILYFTATWCVPCRVMKRQVWADPKVTELVNAGFIPVAIDVGDPANAQIMAAYKIKGPPVTIVCDSHGKAVDWRVGGISKTTFLELLTSSNYIR